jgi:2,3-bisphosphoglycerate-dependent phosphoglycerate mutase
MEILLIRHGETDWNRARRMQGHIDIPLNNEGLRQAKAWALHWPQKNSMRFTPVICSVPNTAQAVADVHQMPLIIDEQLRERCYGVFEGLMYKEVAQQFPRRIRALASA